MPDQLWQTIKDEVKDQMLQEPALGGFFSNRVLQQETLESAVSDMLAHKLASYDMPDTTLKPLLDEAMRSDPAISKAIAEDIRATRQRDPAVLNYSTVMFYYKGFHALQGYRIAHWFWQQDRQYLAMYLQNRISEVLAVDIHPAARIGSGILVDHATGIVIGETSVLEDNISIMQGVTLGGTGKESGDRHPKVRSGVLIGAGAIIIGNVSIGEGAKIGAGSVVLTDVEAHTTVAGVPAMVVGRPSGESPALDMNHELGNKE